MKDFDTFEQQFIELIAEFQTISVSTNNSFEGTTGTSYFSILYAS